MKINVKKLNQFMMNQGNSDSMKTFVEICVQSVLEDEIPNVAKINFLKDLGLLIEN
jgi:ribosomal protein S3AE